MANNIDPTFHENAFLFLPNIPFYIAPMNVYEVYFYISLLIEIFLHHSHYFLHKIVLYHLNSFLFLFYNLILLLSPINITIVLNILSILRFFLIFHFPYYVFLHMYNSVDFLYNFQTIY